MTPGFGAALASEWSKFTSLRSARVTLVLGTVLGIAAPALIGWAIRATWDDWSAEDRAGLAVTDTALLGLVVTGLLFMVLSVTAVSSEYSSRMAALTFTATPRRGRVLLAKVLVVAAVTAVATTVAVLAMIVTARLELAGLGLRTPGAGRTTRLLLGIAANSALFPVLGVSLTFLVRSAAGSVAGLLGLSFGPAVLGPLLPRWWAEHGAQCLPSAAMDALTLPQFAAGEPQLGRALAALVVAGWVAAFLGAALVVLNRRDV